MAEPFRIVVVNRRAGVVARLAAELELATAGTVAVADRHDARTVVADVRPDAVLLDPADLDLVVGIRGAQSGTPVIVLSGEPGLDEAVRAVRAGADEFLPADTPTAELAEHVVRLAETFRANRPSARRAVLAIGAHPDDVEAGVGGILAAHRAAGDPVTVLTLSRGRRDGGLELAREEAAAAAALLDARLELRDLPASFTDFMAAIADLVDEIAPSHVYTHSAHDRRQDHRLVHEATVAATEDVATVACYGGTTAAVDFAPTRFVPIDGHTDTKLALLACFATRGERADYLDPDFVLATARFWSQYGEGRHCEALEIVRESVLSPVASLELQRGTGAHAAPRLAAVPEAEPVRRAG